MASTSIERTPLRPPPPEVAGKRWSTVLRTPWWLWPHLLSLDAPLVALAWQDWWSRSARIPLPNSQRAILGLGVWMIYLADRLADTARGLPDGSSTARHAFAETWRLPLLILTATIGTGLVLLAPATLRTGQFCAGLLLLAAAGAYFWLIHRRSSQDWMVSVPKEAAVGGMFAVGTVFFPLCDRWLPPRLWLVAVPLFASVCFLNCALITSWECNRSDQRDPCSFLNAFPRLSTRGLRPTCWLLTGVAGVAVWLTHDVVFVPIALAACALGALDAWKKLLSINALRSLSDAVLLTPWVCLWMVRAF